MKTDDEISKMFALGNCRMDFPTLHIENLHPTRKSKLLQVARLDFIFQPESVSLSTCAFELQNFDSPTTKDSKSKG